MFYNIEFHLLHPLLRSSTSPNPKQNHLFPVTPRSLTSVPPSFLLSPLPGQGAHIFHIHMVPWVQCLLENKHSANFYFMKYLMELLTIKTLAASASLIPLCKKVM